VTQPLPVFRYHPDPLATGSVVPSNSACRSCGQVRGFVYAGPVYAEDELDDALCPWCIADGSAAEKFDAEFTDPAGVGGYGDWDAVPATVVTEVARRTPGFSGWQQERWWTHCADAAEFLGPAGGREVKERWPGALANLQAESGFQGADWDDYFAALDRESPPTAYVFRCRHCGELGGYSDTD
jgi:uncharacterized protein